MGKAKKKSFVSLYWSVLFIAVVWNKIYNASEVCLCRFCPPGMYLLIRLGWKEIEAGWWMSWFFCTDEKDCAFAGTAPKGSTLPRRFPQTQPLGQVLAGDRVLLSTASAQELLTNCRYFHADLLCLTALKQKGEKLKLKFLTPKEVEFHPF